MITASAVQETLGQNRECVTLILEDPVNTFDILVQLLAVLALIVPVDPVTESQGLVDRVDPFIVGLLVPALGHLEVLADRESQVE